MQPTKHQNLNRIFPIKKPFGALGPFEYDSKYSFDVGIRPMRCKDHWLVPCIHTIAVYDAVAMLFGDDDGETAGGEMGNEYLLSDINTPLYGDSDWPNNENGQTTYTPDNDKAIIWMNGDRQNWVASVSEAPEPQNVHLQRRYYHEGLNIYIKNALWFRVYYYNHPADETTGMAAPAGGVHLQLTFSWEKMDILAFAQLRNCRSEY